MSTWHQDKAPIDLRHATQWTVVNDPQGEPMTVRRCVTLEEACTERDKLDNIHPYEQGRHYIIDPKEHRP